MKPNVRQIIKCPHCGMEYLPGEIYMPGAFIGQPKTVIRDALGKILYEEYEEDNAIDTDEKYTCDKCHETFNIEATVMYRTKVESEELDFKNQYASLLD